MKDIITIQTPDHVELEFDLAGLGSRFAAYTIDFVIMVFLLLVTLLIVLGGDILGLFRSCATCVESGLSSWIIAIYIIVFFLINWGYFIFFEYIMKGQSPGKRQLGLRVLRMNGLPVGPREVFIRNLLRSGDMLPSFYLLGGFIMLLNEKGQRLGDMSAGTIIVRESFASSQFSSNAWSTSWVVHAEKGKVKKGLLLPGGRITTEQLNLIQRYLSRKSELTIEQRQRISWEIVQPLYPILQQEVPKFKTSLDQLRQCEILFYDVLKQAKGEEEGPSLEKLRKEIERKQNHWGVFEEKVGEMLKKGRKALADFPQESVRALLEDYRKLTSDLARARSMGADPKLIRYLNRLAVSGHNLLYGRYQPSLMTPPRQWYNQFAMTLRTNISAVCISAFFFFSASLVSHFAVQWHPELGYDLVSEGFLEFNPASGENLHDIPHLSRPIAASSILTNNIQVSLFAFGMGLSAGVGTLFILVFNGVHLGSVFGWMGNTGNLRALWGWVMPHGVTEILAIIIAGAAGLMLASAILMPGQKTRVSALKIKAKEALILELGVMVMLIVAGFIEGFVSPSSIPYFARITIMGLSFVIWLLYFGFAGRLQTVGFVPVLSEDDRT